MIDGVRRAEGKSDEHVLLIILTKGTRKSNPPGEM